MRLLYWLLDLIFPRKCALCGKLLRKDETDYCHGCRTNSPYFPVLEKESSDFLTASPLSGTIKGTCEGQFCVSSSREPAFWRCLWAEAWL